MGFDLIIIRFNDYLKQAFSNVAFLVVLALIIFNVISFITLYLGYKYHKRFKNKILVYLLDNDFINLIAKELLKAIKIIEVLKIQTLNSESEQQEKAKQSIWIQFKHHISNQLNKVCHTKDIYQGKIYFKYW